ncbi:hypothetical protein GIB67_010804 [Kingdonia uniflora]|uniref:Phosphatidate phosphatase n=1 Tax=Kingdonia uniflora TaxID=39325 RepID=A0A7J7L960_9MAGN|nr:hypothetical protein GIB67_010804 [Kingdonia uniflora]
MYAVGRLISRGVYTVSAPFHPFGGAVDIIVVQQQDGSFKSSPWYVKFGKFQGVLKTREKIVSININGVDAGFNMYLDHKGEAFFLMEVDGEDGEECVGVASFSSGDETDDQSQSEVGRIKKSKSCDFCESEPTLVTEVEVGSRKILARTSSRRSRILGLMFGRKSIKDNSTKLREGGGGSMERISSLETAEIAANLLEMKWSTNLQVPIARPSVKEDDKLLPVNNEQYIETSTLDESVLEGTNEFIPERPRSVEEDDNSLKVNNKQDIETFTSEVSVSESKVTPETSVRISEFEVEDSGFDERGKVLTSEMSVFRMETPSSVLEKGTSMQHGKEQPYDEMVGILCATASNEGSKTLYVDLESSKVNGDTSGKSFGTLNLGHGDCLEDKVHAEVLRETSELLSKVSFEPVCVALVAKESLTDITLSQKNSYEFPDKETILDREKSSDSPHSKTDPQSSYPTSVSTEGEISPMSIEKPAQSGGGHMDDEEPTTSPMPYSQRVSFEHILGSFEEGELHGSCISSSLSNPHHLVQQEEETSNLNPCMDFVGDPQRPSIYYAQTEVSNSSFPPSESSDEDQFQFSDNDEFVPRKVQCMDSDSSEFITSENHQPVTLDEGQNLQGSSDMNRESSPSPIQLVHDCSPIVFGNFLEELRTASSPICVPRTRNEAGNEVERMVESLPIIRSHIDNLGMIDLLQPHSQSLNLSAERLKWESQRKAVSSCLKTDSDPKEPSVNEHYMLEDDTWYLEELKNLTTNKVVDISLCKHLLHEGMGAEAASQAFDAEKVDSDKFVTLGPELVKNDMLIVRIGGSYFPWDAAAPIILGMASFGRDQILELEGMISVNEVENAFEGDPARVIPSGGSWRLWPFSSKRSGILNYAEPAPDCFKTSDVENAPESTSDLTVHHKSAKKVKIGKKKVKSIVPTSEQLATLNLKEGRNVVTFTFSTAMLGEQQVVTSAVVFITLPLLFDV